MDETSKHGKLAFTLGPIAKGHGYDLYMEFQTNPTNVNHRSRTVALYDGGQLITSIDQTMTVYP